MRGRLLIGLLLIGLSVQAVPAYRGGVVRTAPDGTQKTVYLHGNERFHYLTDEAGQWLDETSLEPLSAAAKAARLEHSALRKSPQQKEDLGNGPYPAPRGLIILANYQDVRFQTPTDTVDSMLNATHFARHYSYRHTPKDGHSRFYIIDSEGSARQYFHDQSFGVYNPIFDVVGPVQVSKEMTYYGENDSKGNDKRAAELIKEACEQADKAGVDFTRYDHDNDGNVDFVFVIYAGYGEADHGGENTIWPHQFNLAYTNQRCKVDGKNIGRYACSCELNHASRTYSGIGTFVHEFSHVLGIPDLYETNDESLDIHTLGSWDIMDYGPYNNDGNTPPAYSSYERFFMGWVTPRILKEPEYVSLELLNKTGQALLLTGNDTHNLVGWNPEPRVFYMLEARERKGWDIGIAGGGLMITKIQYDENKWKYNTVNNDPDVQGVDIIEATPDTTPGTSYTDLYPAGATEWKGLRGHEITEIERDKQSGVVTFSFRGAPKPVEPIEIIESKARAIKILRDGQIIILRDDKSFDLHGRPMDR